MIDKRSANKVYWDWMPRPGISLRCQIEHTSSFASAVVNALSMTVSRDSESIVGIERRTVILDAILMIRFRKSF